MDENKLSKYEKKLFRQLPREKSPPEQLEKRVVEKLKKEGLIRKKAFQTYIRRFISSAAAIILFFGGIYFERLTTEDMQKIQPNRGYMLLLHEDEKFQPGKPMEMFNEYKKWMESTQEQGITITGQELKAESVLVSDSGSHQEERGYRTTGYFILEAESLDKAIKVARANPHTKYGGIVEVKPFMTR